MMVLEVEETVETLVQIGENFRFKHHFLLIVILWPLLQLGSFCNLVILGNRRELAILQLRVILVLLLGCVFLHLFRGLSI